MNAIVVGTLYQYYRFHFLFRRHFKIDRIIVNFGKQSSVPDNSLLDRERLVRADLIRAFIYTKEGGYNNEDISSNNHEQ